MGRLLRGLTMMAAPLAIAGCQMVPEPDPASLPPTPVGSTAFEVGAAKGPPISGLALAQDDARSALSAFQESCPVVRRREDLSGLTLTDDWTEPCDALAAGLPNDAPAFFERYFTPVRIGQGAAFATGYFEPEIAGSRVRAPGYDVPVYAVPGDLVRAWPEGTAESERTGRSPLGRYDENAVFVPYFTRAEIEKGALTGRADAIGWAADPIEMFFLQIQGSGRLSLPDGGVMRIGYAGQNGHGYTGIGGLMRERGLLGDGPDQYEGSMQGIVRYLRENPDAGAALMRENESWVFFRELTGDGPIGSIGVPVRGRSSVAVDPRFVPYGAPVWLDLDRDVADGLWIAQDTGGAIKGVNRFDTFWGAGPEAREIAGGMSGRGQALIFLPNAAARRLLER